MAARAPATSQCRSAIAQATTAAPRRGGDRLKNLEEYYEAAKLHSDKNFLILPDEENTGRQSGRAHRLRAVAPCLLDADAHSEPAVRRRQIRTTARSITSAAPANTMEMAKRENMLVFMPHPRSKGSTGYPDAIKDKAHFQHENYRGIGFRWGMGVDGSETAAVRLPLPARCSTT